MYDFDLGAHHRKVATASPDAQTWFDRGLVWTYGYNHDEAIACFRRAIEADPGCAMAHWGVAYASGPHYNRGWETYAPDERAAALAATGAALAAAKAVAAEPVEAALVAALARRYPDDPATEDFGPYNDAFAAAMREVHRAHPHDLDVAALFAEALMNRTPWRLWDLRTGAVAPGADTAEAVATLERAFREDRAAWDHPGLLHLYIHLMEMSPTPEAALRHGDRLATLAPDAGHLLHMATHIDVLCGDYQAVVARNRRAAEADAKFLALRGLDGFYTAYCLHNLHFEIYGALFLAQPTPALATAEALATLLPSETLRPMADWFEAFVPMKAHVLVRFGRWRDILAAELPGDPELYSSTTALWRYARTVALANLGEIAEARDELERFGAARLAVPDSRMLFNNTVRDILGVAEAMAEGEIAYHAGEPDTAFARLRHAVALDDALPYDEPWGWMQPARHALGALLLDAGRTEEAEAVYRADLGLDPALPRACQHPGNVWSLHGLHECLARRGETAEARHVRLALDRALARAEVPIRASCYCRRAAA